MGLNFRPASETKRKQRDQLARTEGDPLPPRQVAQVTRQRKSLINLDRKSKVMFCKTWEQDTSANSKRKSICDARARTGTCTCTRAHTHTHTHTSTLLRALVLRLLPTPPQQASQGLCSVPPIHEASIPENRDIQIYKYQTMNITRHRAPVADQEV